MKLFYLIATCTIGLILIIFSVAQFGATASWVLITSDTSPVLVLLLTALAGSFMGSFFLLFLLTSKQEKDSEETNDEE